jgi:hypothetical protein
MRKKIPLALAIAAVGLVGLMGSDCTPQPTQISHKVHESQKAAAAAEQIRFTENAEIDNIKRRLELTSQPGLLGYIVLINKVGQVVLHTPVLGKVTSGGKRLTRPYAFVRCDKGSNIGDCEVAAPSDEGTYGSSGEYIYFWTPGGQYFQSDLSYVYSHQPFRLTEKPLLDLGALAAPSKTN